MAPRKQNFINVKSAFFDSDVVLAACSKAERSVHGRFGYLVRKEAREKIRKRKKPSKPGKPPHTHGPHFRLRRYLFFGLDLSTRSVVIGPSKLSGKNLGQAPRILEEGGSFMQGDRKVKVKVKKRNSRGQYAKSGTKTKKIKGGRRTIKPRPFMKPAFEKIKPLLPGMWQDSIEKHV